MMRKEQHRYEERELSVIILSDTHGKLDERIAALAADCDIAIHAGDIGNAAVLHAIRPRRARHAVIGNNDLPERWPEGDRPLLAQLPDQLEINLPGGLLVITHGHQFREAKTRHQRLRSAFPNAFAIVYGHSHRFVIDDSDAPWLLNPGAAGWTRTYGGPSSILLRIDNARWRLEPCRFEMR